MNLPAFFYYVLSLFYPVQSDIKKSFTFFTSPIQPAPSIVEIGEGQASTQLSLVGGKGSSLSTLQSIPGVSVPEGFIVTTAIYQDFISEQKSLLKELRKLDELSDAWVLAKKEGKEIAALDDQISKQAQTVQDIILSSPMPQTIQDKILTAYHELISRLQQPDLAVAVRSSATAEDLPNASFAGQHSTFLNQKGDAQVLNSVVGCWASLFQPHAVHYRNQLRLSLEEARELRAEEVKLAVVIQRTIQPQAAGVGFNITPAGEAKIYLEANYGLGETVVSGSVTPDAWELSPRGDQILMQRLGEKSEKSVSSPEGGIQTINVDIESQNRFAFNEAQALEIGASIAAIGDFYRNHFDYPFIDTEFVLNEEGKLYFVQARPETVYSRSTNAVIKKVAEQQIASANILYQGGNFGYPGAYTGRLVYAKTAQEALEKLQPGDILVTRRTTPDWSVIFSKLGGVIVDRGGTLSHTAIVGREQRIPTLLAAEGATQALAAWDGQEITLDATNQTIYEGALPLIDTSLAESFGKTAQTDLYANILTNTTPLIDEKGKWVTRPSAPLSRFQLQFTDKGFHQVGLFLGIEIPTQIVNDVQYAMIENMAGEKVGYSQISEELSRLSLDELEDLIRQKTLVENELLSFSEHFAANDPEQLKTFQKLYQDWMTHYQMRGRLSHGVIASLTQQHLTRLPHPEILSGYLNLRYPMQNETHDKRQEHNRLVSALREAGVGKDASQEEVMKHHPALWNEIEIFADSYEHVHSYDMRTPVPVAFVFEQLLATLDDEMPLQESPLLNPEHVAQMDRFFQDNPETDQVMRMFHVQSMEKENEHHRMTRFYHKFNSALLHLGEQLTAAGTLSSPEQVLDYTVDELIAFL